jgi:molecular chaperone DnaK (HSP70)
LIKNNIYNPNKLKANKLYIGLELGNTECKIGFFKQSKSNFDLSNSNNNYLSFPTIISFISNKTNNYNIKIGEEAEKLRISNSSQTIFNIIKLFGKNTNEILGRKDL